ncbi:glycosyltransferase [Leuconostoc lactis]|uniref:glycosyltransferase n=1 Tax=Leuconostoc lactis TaxID=1246 RepID=UPI0004966FD0|nr:glycosyltransferase [Leuconostoc lactis]
MIGIVVLNYLNWWDTVDLVESIKSQSFKNFEIIIVDNDSANDSVEQLTTLYKNESNIHLLVSKSNQGYARGNNIGIEYAINSLKVKKVLLVNNDVLFLQADYLERLATIEYSKNVGAIGTKILDANNENHNPMYNVKSFREASLGVVYNSLVFRIVRNFLRPFKQRIAGSIHSKNSSKENEKNSISNASYILHGSVILLTENYLNIYPGLYPKTFMFFEENILDYLLKRHNLETRYYDNIVVKHKEDQSSNVAFEDINSIKQTMLQNSRWEYLKLLLMTDKKIKRIFSNVKPEYEVKF